MRSEINFSTDAPHVAVECFVKDKEIFLFFFEFLCLFMSGLKCLRLYWSVNLLDSRCTIYYLNVHCVAFTFSLIFTNFVFISFQFVHNVCLRHNELTLKTENAEPQELNSFCEYKTKEKSKFLLIFLLVKHYLHQMFIFLFLIYSCVIRYSFHERKNFLYNGIAVSISIQYNFKEIHFSSHSGVAELLFFFFSKTT